MAKVGVDALGSPASLTVLMVSVDVFLYASISVCVGLSTPAPPSRSLSPHTHTHTHTQTHTHTHTHKHTHTHTHTHTLTHVHFPKGLTYSLSVRPQMISSAKSNTIKRTVKHWSTSGMPTFRCGRSIQYNFIAKCQCNCTGNVLWTLLSACVKE